MGFVLADSREERMLRSSVRISLRMRQRDSCERRVCVGLGLGLICGCGCPPSSYLRGFVCVSGCSPSSYQTNISTKPPSSYRINALSTVCPTHAIVSSPPGLISGVRWLHMRMLHAATARQSLSPRPNRRRHPLLLIRCARR